MADLIFYPVTFLALVEGQTELRNGHLAFFGGKPRLVLYWRVDDSDGEESVGDWLDLDPQWLQADAHGPGTYFYEKPLELPPDTAEG